MTHVDYVPPQQPTGMNCPVCHIEMVTSEREGVEFDICPECRGIWLDRGELNELLARLVMVRPAEPGEDEPLPSPTLPQYDVTHP